MMTLSTASQHFATSLQTLVDYVTEFPSLFKSTRSFSAHELALLGVIHRSRKQGIADHHGVWVQIVLFIRKHPMLAVKLANHKHSQITQRYLGILRDVLDSREPAGAVARRLDANDPRSNGRVSSSRPLQKRAA